MLRAKVIPDLLERVPEDQEIRVWDCGCSTGEEAYSIAILFLEAFAAAGREPRLKILATDLHDESLQQAGMGGYGEDSFIDMASDVRERYFEPLGDGRFKVLPQLRKMLIFSRHNLLNDPPFTHIDLVSCRNLLIYLQQAAQVRAIASFHYSLRVKGVLFLGASESLGELLEEFEVVERHWKFFRKVSENRQLASMRLGGTDNVLRDPHVSRSSVNAPLLQVYDSLLKEYIPSGILVNEKNEVVHVFGDAKRFIHAESGRFSGELSSLLPKELQLPLIAAQRNATKTKEKCTLRSVRFMLDGVEERLHITVSPVISKTTNAPYFMITLEDEAPIARTNRRPPWIPSTSNRRPNNTSASWNWSCNAPVNHCRRRWRNWKRATRNCRPATRSYWPATRNCRAPTNNCTRSTRNCTASTPSTN